MQEEIWKNSLSSDLYEISSIGNVRRIGKSKILSQYTNKKGYKTVALSSNGNVKTCYVHRLVAEVFLENPNKYKEVNHKNGIKKDNFSENLEYCTHKQNSQHANRLGLFKLSEKTKSAARNTLKNFTPEQKKKAVETKRKRYWEQKCEVL